MNLISFPLIDTGKVKVKASLCIIKQHTTKTYGAVDVWLHAFLTFALDGGEQLPSYLSHFTPGKQTLVSTGERAGQDLKLVQMWRKRITICP
jgi:hypothetical protein